MSGYDKAGPEWDTRIRVWMMDHAHEYRDPETGEYNRTVLAEMACETFDLYINESEIPSDLFEIAHEVISDIEMEERRRTMP